MIIISKRDLMKIIKMKNLLKSTLVRDIIRLISMKGVHIFLSQEDGIIDSTINVSLDNIKIGRE